MKTQTFLEYCQGIYRKRLEQLDSFGKTIDDIERAINFYSRPFKPEMITELFEGWKPDMTAYKNKDLRIRINFWDNRMTVMFYDTEKTCINTLMYKIPKTLDGFKYIMEEQAIIPLDWKPKIVKEVFNGTA